MVATLVRRALLLCLVAALSGCAQAQVSALRGKCDFSADSRFASIRGKVGLSPTEREATPTLRQIDDNSRPTPEQREALLDFDEANIPCRQGAMAIASRYGSADIVGLFQELSLARTNQLKLLINGEITFGGNTGTTPIKCSPARTRSRLSMNARRRWLTRRRVRLPLRSSARRCKLFRPSTASPQSRHAIA